MWAELLMKLGWDGIYSRLLFNLEKALLLRQGLVLVSSSFVGGFIPLAWLRFSQVPPPAGFVAFGSIDFHQIDSLKLELRKEAWVTSHQSGRSLWGGLRYQNKTPRRGRRCIWIWSITGLMRPMISATPANNLPHKIPPVTLRPITLPVWSRSRHPANEAKIDAWPSGAERFKRWHASLSPWT